MRNKALFVSILLPVLGFAQNMVETKTTTQDTPQTLLQTEIVEDNDSFKAEQLKEIVVEGSSSIQTASKTILYPTKIEKQHSTNGYELLQNMNLPDIEVRANTQQIMTLNGKEVVVLINGVEALNDELSTLSGTDIVSIDFQRNPSGKYAGKGGVMNFVTRQYEYGGNLFLSYGQGFTHLYGDYLGMVSYKRKAFSATLTTSAKWNYLEGENPANNCFKFPQGDLYQIVTTLDNTTYNNAEYGRLKLSHAENNHTLSFAISLNRKGQPKRSILEHVDYQGIWNGQTLVEKESKELAVSPQITVDYNLVLPKSQYLSLKTVSSFANSSLNSNYKEQVKDNLLNQIPIQEAEIQNSTKEKNWSVDFSLTYKKSFSNGITLGGTVNNTYQNYRDNYSGNFLDSQTLENNEFQLLAQFSQSIPPKNLSYYVDLGASSLISKLNGVKDSQWFPTAYYGATYALNQNHSFSFDGVVEHSVYDPSYKNDAIVFSSPFEATIGNPSLKPFRAFFNSVSYNGRFRNFKLFASYEFFEYKDNLINNYFIEDDIVYRQLQNDGNFYWHSLHAGLSLNLLQGKLSIGGNGLVCYNHFGSKTRPTQATIFRGSLNAVSFLGPWRLRVFYAPQRKAMNWDGSRLFDPTQYGLNAQWSHKNWKVECSIENFLKRYQGQKVRSDYGCYQSSRMNRTNAQGRNISMKVVYTLSYGKKSNQHVDESDTKIDNTINSAILRPF